MKKTTAILFTLFLFCLSGFSQGFTAYSDFRDHFYIFDNGKTLETESHKVTSWRAGGKAVAYVDNSGNLKFYAAELLRPIKLSDLVNKYYATDYYIVCEANQQLVVASNKDRTVLSGYFVNYAVGENTIAFSDKTTQRFKVFHNGKIHDLEDAIVGPVISNYKVAENIVGYVDKSNYLKVFYNGNVTELYYADGNLKYNVGRNILAYNDEVYNSFAVFYKGEKTEIETFLPEEFKMGDDMVAYIDLSGALKVFREGNIETVCSYTPDFYHVEDNVIVFGEQGYLKTFYKGQVYTLEKYVPQNLQYDYNAVAYINQAGKLKLFNKGSTKIVTHEKINDFELVRNTLYFNTGVNTNHVYFEGKLY